jgi:hypothetical protein
LFDLNTLCLERVVGDAAPRERDWCAHLRFAIDSQKPNELRLSGLQLRGFCVNDEFKSNIPVPMRLNQVDEYMGSVLEGVATGDFLKVKTLVA